MAKVMSGAEIVEKYELLESFIKDTSLAMEYFVDHQKAPVKVQYVKWTMYLCLVKLRTPTGECYGMRWAKFRIAKDSDRRVWYKGWKLGNIPASAIRRIVYPEDQERVRFLDQQARKLVAVRKDLTTKKKRILGTLQVITDAYRDKVDAIMEETETAQQERSQSAYQERP
mgnify:CR=1 FL=1